MNAFLMNLVAMILTTLPVATQEDDKKYDLNRENETEAGMAWNWSDDQTTSTYFKLSLDGEEVSEENSEQSTSLAGVVEILAIEDDVEMRMQVAFSEATDAIDDEKVVLSFDGKTVLITFKDDGTSDYRLEDGTPLTEREYEVLYNAFGATPEDIEAEDAMTLVPEHPVAVGEKWLPNFETWAVYMGDEDSVYDPDHPDTKGWYTLKSVDERDGVLFATIGMDFQMAVLSMGELEFETPFLMIVDGEASYALGGSSFDSTTDIQLIIKGESLTTIDEIEFLIEMNVTVSIKNEVTDIE